MQHLHQRPDPDKTYVTIFGVNGEERYVLVEDVYLPGDQPVQKLGSAHTSDEED